MANAENGSDDIVFALANFDPEGERHYSTGGEIWDADPEEAVRFYSQFNAQETIGVLKKAFPKLSPTVHVVTLKVGA